MDRHKLLLIGAFLLGFGAVVATIEPNFSLVDGGPIGIGIAAAGFAIGAGMHRR